MSRPIISLQLYTVRDAYAADPLGTLEKIAQIGYEGIETGYGDGPRDEFLAKVNELGLKVTGSHVGLDALENELDAIVADARLIGTEFIIIPWIGEELRGSAEKWIALAKRLEAVGKKLSEQGLTLCYHNHDFEVSERYDGQSALQILYANSDPQYVKAELDTYWVEKGGASALEYIQEQSGRLPLLHIKDITPDGVFAEVGAGTLDFEAIFAAAEAQGVQVYAVEQDVCPGDPFDSIRISLENLKKWGKLS